MFPLELANGNRWLLGPDTCKGSGTGRFASLLGLVDQQEPSNFLESTAFPYYPLETVSSYTFFDYTRDTVQYFLWLKEQASHQVISFQEIADGECTDVLANLGVINRSINIRNELDGGFLVHGVMVEHELGAIVLAGASGIGKTTAARRMPNRRWRKCSDDLTLVTRAKDAAYFAHPWPGEKAYRQHELRYESSRGIPLKALFFLVPDSNIDIKRCRTLNAVAMLRRVVNQALDLPDPSTDPKNIGTMSKVRLDAICRFVESVPTFELALNLVDPFWIDIEACLRDET